MSRLIETGITLADQITNTFGCQRPVVMALTNMRLVPFALFDVGRRCFRERLLLRVKIYQSGLSGSYDNGNISRLYDSTWNDIAMFMRQILRSFYG